MAILGLVSQNGEKQWENELNYLNKMRDKAV